MIKGQFLGCLFVMLLAFMPAQTQEPTGTQDTLSDQEKAIQSAPSALTAYTKWRDESLSKYLQREQTPHYAVAVVAQRLDDNTAQVGLLVAADMKHYTVTIQPVTLAKQTSGEVISTPAGKAVAIDQKAGRKL